MNAGPPSEAPTPEELSEGAIRLLAEVDAALTGDRFAILNIRSLGTLHRYYDAAAL